MNAPKCFGWMVITLACTSAVVAQASTTNPVFLSVPPLAPIAQSGSYDMNGAVGGSITVGRFTIRVARGAYAGVSRITINVPDPAVLKCNVTMSPLPSTFKTKPTLEAKYSGASGTAKGFWWINCAPSTGIWAASSSNTVSTKQLIVSQSLSVFSEHGVAATKTNW